MKTPALKRWWRAASSAERTILARLADTSVAHLTHIIAGRRNCGPALARRIELGTVQIGLRAIVRREDLCAACRKCEYAAGR